MFAHLRHTSVYLGVHNYGIPVCICVYRLWAPYSARSLVFELYSRIFWDSLLENLGKSQKKWRRLEGITWRGKFLLKLQRVERMTDSLKRGICSKEHWYKPPPTPEGCRCATVCARSETSECGSSRQRGLSLSTHSLSLLLISLRKQDFGLLKPVLEKHVLPATLYCSETLGIFDESRQIIGLGL